MIKNYFLIAIRNIKKHKAYSTINIVGLAIGMACSILILLWVQDELRFDKWHSKSERMGRVLVRVMTNGEPYEVAVNPAALGPNLQKDFPEMESVCRFKNWGEWLFLYKDGEFIQANSGAIDSTAFDIFDFKFLFGSKEKALTDPHSLVLTEDLSHRIFGDENPIGKVLEVKDRGVFKVVAVIADVEHSHFDFDFLFPFQVIKEDGENIDEMGQGSYNFAIYFLLKNKNLFSSVDEKLKNSLNKFSDENTTELFSQKFKDIYLHSNFAYDFIFKGDITNVITFSTIAFLVLIIACINFMNLTTARSSNRAKEIGLRKVVGAKRSSVISQFLSESILMSFVSFIIALAIVGVLLPKFNELSGKELTPAMLIEPSIVLMLILIALITGILAGSYPAFFLSAFNPIKVLKGKLSNGAKSSLFRKVLVVIQFTLSVALIVSTIMISKQMRFVKNKDLGYNKNHLVHIAMNGGIRKNFESLKQQLLQNPNIKGVTTSRVLPVYACPSTSINEWEGKDDDREMTIHFFPVGYDFFETMEISMVDGRTFSKDFSADTVNSFIINQEAAKQMGMENPVGKTMSLHGTSGYIIGVMKDFNFNNIRNKIAPLVLFMNHNQARICFVRISENNTQETLSYIEDVWKRFEPDYDFNFRFMDESLARLYRSEQRSNTLINYFSIFSIFISCLGIFGLASFMAEQKTKEIGVRKVLGADIPHVVRIFSVEFTKLVLIGNVLAYPIAVYAMNKWLSNFAYHTNLTWWIFVLAAVISFTLVLITIAYQSYKAAVKNPVLSLRYE
ncbi:MAG TPA: ABC transporter permease [Tenuifilaceae bacterium]|nr:ABC transporter permease [Tenuifilaceae bacterium]HPQ35056.1 ABC transporter permease [Tenuifilaceae bacterium]HRX68576.1 ABC transporter permease [Tenuifilaceae bacterium]